MGSMAFQAQGDAASCRANIAELGVILGDAASSRVNVAELGVILGDAASSRVNKIHETIFAP
jgi:hypothetical protein